MARNKRNWIPSSEWNKMSIGEKVLASFEFTKFHLNVDHNTWNQMTRYEQITFLRKKKRWLRRNGTRDWRVVNFWKNHYRYQGKIWNIYSKKPYLLNPEVETIEKEEANNIQPKKEIKCECYQISRQNIEIQGIGSNESIAEKNYHFWENKKKKYFDKLNYIKEYIFKYAEYGYIPMLYYKDNKYICECEQKEKDSEEEEDEFGFNNIQKDIDYEEKKSIYCPGCDEYEEMYFGICLKCGDDSNMSEAINPDKPPKWMPNPKLNDDEKLKEIKDYLRFTERLTEEEIKGLEKEFEETIFLYCSSCDEVSEMYYGICLNCGDESEKEYVINEMERPKWMPDIDLVGIEKAIAIKNYISEKEKEEKKE